MSPDKPLQSDEQGSKHLDMIRPGEIGHVHFQDVRDIPREFAGCFHVHHSRRWNKPLARNLCKRSEKGYAGPLSVEHLLPNSNKVIRRGCL